MKVSNINVLNLVNEIVGFKSSDGSVSAKGILNEMISIKTKYHIKGLLKDLYVYKDRFVEAYRDWCSENDSDDFMRFISENQDLANAKVEVVDCDVSIDDLNFESEYPYPFFISIVVDKED